jgi:hypothetical protein
VTESEKIRALVRYCVDFYRAERGPEIRRRLAFDDGRRQLACDARGWTPAVSDGARPGWLADNMMDFNPVAVDALIRLTLGGLPPGRDGGLLNARLRYFDPARKRAGLPEDVAALVSGMTATSTTLTLVNLNQVSTRTVVVQGGSPGERAAASRSR